MLEKNGQAFCKFCAKPVIGTLYHMLRHGESVEHMNHLSSMDNASDASDDNTFDNTDLDCSSYQQSCYAVVSSVFDETDPLKERQESIREAAISPSPSVAEASTRDKAMEESIKCVFVVLVISTS